MKTNGSAYLVRVEFTDMQILKILIKPRYFIDNLLYVEPFKYFFESKSCINSF